MTTKTIGNDNETIVVGSNLTLNVGDGNDTITAGSNDIITVGNGNDTITIGSQDTLTVGNGSVTVIAGSYDAITVGSGNHTITAGSNATIVAGNGSGKITAGANSSVRAGNGNNAITAGPSSAITAGNGPDNVHAGANTTISLGSGPDTISAGSSDVITVGNGPKAINYDGLTPTFTAPASLTVSEEHSIALPITLLAPAFGKEVINGFTHQNSVIGFDKADFANYAAVMAATTQVGANTVITLDAGDTVTLTNTSKSSLSASNFTFFNGATDVVNITGVPLDATLSAGVNNGGGSWTLTPAQLAGLQLKAGEPIGYPTPDNLIVTVTDPAGQGAAASRTIPLVVTAIPPTVGDSVLGAHPGDPVNETRLEVTAAADSSDGGSDYINRLVFSGLPTGVTLSGAGLSFNSGNDTYTLTTSGNPGTLGYEVDVNAPAGQSTNFNLGIAAFADEPQAQETSASTSQNIDVTYSSTSQNLDFTSSGQSIWTSGSAFSKTFDNFLGIDYPNNFPIAPPASGSTSVLGTTFGASFGLKAGFQSDLTVNGGTFSGQLPFNVTLDETHNLTNNTLEIDPTESQLGGGSFSTTGPGGSYKLGLVFDVFAKAYGGPLKVTLATNVTLPLLNKNSSTLSGSFNLPDGIGTVAFHWPQVNTTGSNPNPGTISSKGTSAPVFQVNIDPVAVVLDAILGNDPLKGSVGSAPLQLSYTILAATLAPAVDVQQSFNLNASGLTPTLKNGNGSIIPFSFGTPTVLDNPSNTNFNLSLTPDATLENTTSLAGQLVVGLRALKGSVTVGFPPLSTTASLGPLVHVKTTLGPATIANLYQHTFPVAFNSQAVTFHG